MKERIGEFLQANPVMAGLIFIIIGLIFLLFRLGKNNSFKMKDHRYISWRLLVKTWGVIVMFILMGLIIIINNI